MNKLIIAVGVYLIVMPIVFRLIGVAHTKLVINRKMMKAGNNKMALKNIPKPLWPKWRERLKVTFKDKRTVQLGKKKGDKAGLQITNQQLFFGLYTLGLLTVIVSTFLPTKQSIIVGAIGYTMFFITMATGIRLSDSLIRTREKVFSKMFEIAKAKLGQSAEYDEQPQAVIQVLDWVDYIKPNKVVFDVPTTFGAEQQEGFMKQFNQVFGTETAWVPSDDPESGKPGWDYEEGKVTIHAVPPLPRSASWSEHYVLAEGIAWSFFPIGLGVENGVELPNPETGVIENVLGFDVSGEQEKVGSKAGLKVSQTITTAPMAFIGGGTGGGKSLDLNTPIRRLKRDRH